MHGAPVSFADFQAAPGTRTPAQILAHMGDLFDWALSMARGQEKWHDSAPLAWEAEQHRFFASLKAFDDYLAKDPEEVPRQRLFQGPVADALTHTGQISMLRRMAGFPVKGENYSRASIEVGHVGADQAKPAREFE